MYVSRATSRLSRTVYARCRNSLLLYPRPKHQLPVFSNEFHYLPNSQYKVLRGQVSSLHNSARNTSIVQRFGVSSSASPQIDEKEISESEDAAANKINDDTEADPDVKSDLSKYDLIKLLAEKTKLLKSKDKEIEQMKDKVLLAYADMENGMDRTRREADNSKKFAIQNFAKSLLDVADNLGRASSVVKESFSKIDTSMDSTGAVPLLKTLLEGVEMTEKQLAEVLRKFGVEKYDPTNEQFDPHRHNAVFQVPDPSKAPDTIAVVLKPGYMLHDRIIRPAEVGVTVAVDN